MYLILTTEVPIPTPLIAIITGLVCVGILLILAISRTRKHFDNQKDEEVVLNDFEQRIFNALTRDELVAVKDELSDYALYKDKRMIKSVLPVKVKQLFFMIRVKYEFLVLQCEIEAVKKAREL